MTRDSADCDALVACEKRLRTALDAGEVLSERALLAEATLAEVKRQIEAWIRRGEAVPADVTTYERWIVHRELRDLLTNVLTPGIGGADA